MKHSCGGNTRSRTQRSPPRWQTSSRPPSRSSWPRAGRRRSRATRSARCSSAFGQQGSLSTPSPVPLGVHEQTPSPARSTWYSTGRRGNCSEQCAPQRRAGSNLAVNIGVNLAILSQPEYGKRPPIRPAYSGTVFSVEGISDTLTITIDSWRVPGEPGGHERTRRSCTTACATRSWRGCSCLQGACTRRP